MDDAVNIKGGPGRRTQAEMHSQNGGTPREGQAQCSARGAVDAKVEQEAAHSGDDQKS